MDLDGIMLGEITQRKTNTLLFHLYVKSKKPKQANKYNKIETDFIDTENQLVVSRGEGGRVFGVIVEAN